MQDSSPSTLTDQALAEQPSEDQPVPSETFSPRPTSEPLSGEELAREEQSILLAHHFAHSTYEKYSAASLRRYLRPVSFHRWLEIALKHSDERQGGNLVKK